MRWLLRKWLGINELDGMIATQADIQTNTIGAMTGLTGLVGKLAALGKEQSKVIGMILSASPEELAEVRREIYRNGTKHPIQ